MDQVWAFVLLALLIASVLAVAAAITLIQLIRATNNERRQDRALDLARQDAVAEQARETAALLLESNKRFASVTKTTNSKLDTIHTLVNSNLTAAMLAELGATEAGLSLMRELTDDRKARGIEPSPDAIARIRATEKRVNDLRAQVEDRQEADKTATRQGER